MMYIDWIRDDSAFDPFYDNCVLLLHGNGADGSTTFTDNSSYAALPDTIGGNTQIDTAQSVFGGASILFDGTGDYLRYNNSTKWEPFQGDYTWEVRVRLSSVTGIKFIFSYQSQADLEGWILYVNEGVVYFSAGNSIVFNWELTLNSTTELTANTWYTISVSRISHHWYMHINGVMEDSQSSTFEVDYQGVAGTRYLTIGAAYSLVYPFNGHMEEVRLTKGVGRYNASNYTPATAAFPDA